MKSTGMTFAPGIRSVRFTGFSVALMLLSTCSCSDRLVIKVNAMVGEAAALPCMCPPDRPPYLVWQKPIGDQALVVNYYKDDDQEDNQMALEYRNRTELRLAGNCSLVIRSVCSSDQGLYICYYKKRPLRHEKIYLKVTAQQVQGKESDEPQNAQSTIVMSSICGFLVILITIAAVYVGITCRNRHQIRRTFIATSMRSI